MSEAYLNEIVIESVKREVADNLINALQKVRIADYIDEEIKNNKTVISCGFGDFGKASMTSLDEAIEIKGILFEWIKSNPKETIVMTHDVSCYLDGDYARVIYEYCEGNVTVKDWFSETPISPRRKKYNTFSFELQGKDINLLTGEDDLVYPTVSTTETYYDDEDDDFFNDINYQRSCIDYRVEELYSNEVINQLISWLSGSPCNLTDKDEQKAMLLEIFEAKKQNEGMNFQQFLEIIDDRLA